MEDPDGLEQYDGDDDVEMVLGIGRRFGLPTEALDLVRDNHRRLTNSPTSTSRDLSSVRSTNASAVRVLTKSAPHACMARSITGGFSSTRSVGVCTTGICGRKTVKNMYTDKTKRALDGRLERGEADAR